MSAATVDVSSRTSVQALAGAATAFGDVTGVIHAAGVSPSQAAPEVILAVDLYGTAVVLEEFGNIIAPDGARSGAPTPPWQTAASGGRKPRRASRRHSCGCGAGAAS